MARVQLIIPDEDHDRFVHQAHLEDMTFSAWGIAKFNAVKSNNHMI